MPEQQQQQSQQPQQQPQQQQQQSTPAQTPPGTEALLVPKADHGESSYVGHGRLDGKATLVTGADSGIGRAVALAFAREGADVLISYLNEDEDARETARLVEEAGRKAVLVPGDLADPAHCRAVVERAVREFGRIDVLVNNAAFQMSHPRIEDIPDEEWERTFAVNISAMFYICKAAVPHMGPGSAIINTSSVNSDKPSPTLLAYAATKGAIANFSAGLAQSLAERGIRVNSVAPGPIWTPLIPSTMPPDEVAHFGQQVPMKRPGQPAEVAPTYVFLASDQASYISGARVAVTGGVPIL
ncbi:glucose 1-dehydrogenase [uncultured Massilia sp.]|uniref:glucose 1-dehydrogenase n=1 Tax=uncultured Massilia sp. TaxID=169973 RepID=UPI0025F4AA7A|nr:glucose 1-dehydrogenase [uncultured Massilia sp.]